MTTRILIRSFFLDWLSSRRCGSIDHADAAPSSKRRYQEPDNTHRSVESEDNHDDQDDDDVEQIVLVQREILRRAPQVPIPIATCDVLGPPDRRLQWGLRSITVGLREGTGVDLVTAGTNTETTRISKSLRLLNTQFREK